MTKRYFTPEEIKQLALSPYIDTVHPSRVTYSDAFIKIFIERYQSGDKPSVIFKECGLDPLVFGQSRISGFSRKYRRYNTYEDYLSAKEQGANEPKARSSYDEIKRLKHENELLKQSNEVLKKSIFIYQQHIEDKPSNNDTIN